MRYLLYILLFISTNAYSQNLVYNGSMEEYYQCPDNTHQLHYSKGWFGYDGQGGSCDYFNVCDSTGFVIYAGVPKNAFGFQYPRTGNAYQGFLLYSTVVTSNEFSMTKFKKKLKKRIT